MNVSCDSIQQHHNQDHRDHDHDHHDHDDQHDEPAHTVDVAAMNGNQEHHLARPDQAEERRK